MKSISKKSGIALILSWLIYLIGFRFLYPLLEVSVGILSIPAAIITGWVLGPVAGFVAGILGFLIATGLLINYPGEKIAFLNPVSIIGPILVSFLGTVAGVLGKSTRKAREELALRIEIEKELLATQERYRSILDAQDDLIDLWLPDTSYTYVNPAYCRFFGKPYEEMIGTRFIDMVEEDKKDFIKKIIASYTPENPTFEDVALHINANGEKRWVQWHDFAQFDENGNLLEVQSVGA